MERSILDRQAARCRFRRIVAKVGSNVLARSDGTLDTARSAALVDQLAALHRAGVELVAVSSGAVASGRGAIAAAHRLDAVSARQLYSAVAVPQRLFAKRRKKRPENFAFPELCTTFAANHFVKPSAEPNEVRAMPRRETEGTTSYRK